MKLEKPVRQQLNKDRPCNGCGRTEGDAGNVEDWICEPCRQNRSAFLHAGGTEEEWSAHRKQYVKKRADKHTGAMSPDQDRLLADFHRFLHIMNRLRCTKQEMKSIIAIIERHRLCPIRRWIPDDLRTITNAEWKVFLKDRVQPDEQEAEGEGGEFQSAVAELDVNTKESSRSYLEGEDRRQMAEAAILNVLGHHPFAKMGDFRRDPLLATLTYPKLLHILNEGVRESKWARRGRTSGASWHMMESGVNMNTEESSRSQQEIPKTEKPSTERETKAQAAKG